jgi:hypothetical protein
VKLGADERGKRARPRAAATAVAGVGGSGALPHSPRLSGTACNDRARALQAPIHRTAVCIIQFD